MNPVTKAVGSARWTAAVGQCGRRRIPRIEVRRVSSTVNRRHGAAGVAELPSRNGHDDATLAWEGDRYRLHQGVSPLQRDVLRSDSKYIGQGAGEILYDLLLRHNVDQIFAHSCHSSSPVFRPIFASTRIQSITPRHEQGTGHMAEGYSRATGRPGVVLVTKGSGVTNLVTPMQDALCDGTPMVVLCGHLPSGHAIYQPELDVEGLAKGCTKWNLLVRSIEELPQRITEAFAIATSGRPGPVLVEIPPHIGATPLSRPAVVNSSFMSRLCPPHGVPNGQAGRHLHRSLQRVARLVNMARKPVLYVGQGMLSHAEGPQILKEFADKTAIPVTTSLQGLGAFDELDPKALHMLGLHGTAYANLAMQEADLIIALGARFDDRVTGSVPKFAPGALAAAAEDRGGIVHFDITPKNIDKVIVTTEAVQGDCATNLQRLTPLVDAVTDRPAWFAQIDHWKAKYPLSAFSNVPTTPVAGLIRAQQVIQKLSDMVVDAKDRTIITTGVGQHQMWAAQHFRWRHPRTMITSGGLGTMGYGLPAAIGAKRGRPDCLVVDIDGDASFNMTIAELSTAANYNIGVKVLLFNNEQMGMVSDLQRLYYSERFVHNRQANPDFVKASEALGVPAQRCADPADVEAKLKWLLTTDGPALLEVVTEQNSPVWPVVPAGKGLHEFITYAEAVATSKSLSE